MSRKRQLKAAQAAQARIRRKSRKRKRTVILVLEVLMLVLLSGTAYVMAKYDKFQTVTINKDDIKFNEGISQEGYTTVALFGGDSRDGQLEAGTHADTMIIAAIDNESGEIRMASLYRDTFLQQADGTYMKANNAYFCGGPKEAINLLNKNLDLDIQDYVTVDFKALVDTIDLLGGIDIDIKDEEIQYINKFLTETAKVAKTEANTISQAGEQHLDGTQAVTYARIRSTEGGDYTRTERQRLVIEKLFEKAVKTNLSTVNKIIDTVFPQVSTSFKLKELIGLASGITQYKLKENTGFPIDKTDGTYEGAGSIVIPIGLTENVQKLHEFLYPKEKNYTPSETLKKISDEIAYLTGVSALNYGTDTGTSSEIAVDETAPADETYLTDPNASDPGVTDPYAADPNAVDPYAADPHAVDPNAADPYAADPNAVDPYASDPNAVDPYSQ